MIVVKETYQSRTLSKKQRGREYLISGVPDAGDDSDDLALAALLGYVPGSMGGLLLSPDDCSVEDNGKGRYTGKAVYTNTTSDPTKQPAGSFNISFNIGSTTKNRKQSLSTRHKYSSSPSTARDFKGAINVDGDGNIAGVDINVPIVSYTINWTKLASEVNDAYEQILLDTVGHFNMAAWRGKPIGSLLLVSVTGQRRDSDNWDLSANFAYQKNTAIADNYMIDTIGPIEAYGWEYVWVYYEETSETISNVTHTRRKATNAYVEQVYDSADYDQLAIPVTPPPATGG